MAPTRRSSVLAGNESMRDVLLYDANPSVREILASKLSQMKLNVVVLQNPEDTEDALMRAKNPFLLILDMSRCPDRLPAFQKFVGRYISDTTHCILTSVTPASLAHYLPYDLSVCFFSHVVERPFRMREFLMLIDSVCAASDKVRSKSTFPVINSSVEQITGPVAVEVHDPVEERQVDELVESISMRLNVVEDDANQQNSNVDVQMMASSEIPDPFTGSMSARMSQIGLELRATSPRLEAYSMARSQEKSDVVRRTGLVTAKNASVECRGADTREVPMTAGYAEMEADEDVRVAVNKGADSQSRRREAKEGVDDSVPLKQNFGIDTDLTGQRKTYSSQERRISRDSRNRGSFPRQSRSQAPVRTPSTHGSKDAVHAVAKSQECATERASGESLRPVELAPLPALAFPEVTPLPKLGMGQVAPLPSLSNVDVVPLPSLGPMDATLLPSLAVAGNGKDVSSSRHTKVHASNDAYTKVQEQDETMNGAPGNGEAEKTGDELNIDFDVECGTNTSDGLPQASDNDDDELESTMLITNDVMKKALDPAVRISQLLPLMSGQLSIASWIDILRLNVTLVERVTVEIGTAKQQTILVMDLGSVVWAEKMTQDKMASVQAFVTSVSDTAPQNMEKITALLAQGSDLSSALMSLDLFGTMLDAFEKRLAETIRDALNVKNVPFRVFRGTTRAAANMLKERPALSFPLASVLFGQCRAAKMEIVACKFRKFVARPYRTIINATVSLLPQEMQILDMLGSPQSLNFINQNLPFDAAPFLPGLVLFGFADMTM